MCLCRKRGGGGGGSAIPSLIFEGGRKSSRDPLPLPTSGGWDLLEGGGAEQPAGCSKSQGDVQGRKERRQSKAALSCWFPSAFPLQSFL